MSSPPTIPSLAQLCGLDSQEDGGAPGWLYGGMYVCLMGEDIEASVCSMVNGRHCNYTLLAQTQVDSFFPISTSPVSIRK